jgi:GTP pyrophosphokinase
VPEAFTDTPILTERFEAALRFALGHHRRQLRKGGQVPYFAHLMAVASIVLEMDGSEEEAIGALLHDVVEDGGDPTALEAIRERFGEQVAAIVAANSDTDAFPKPPWRDRKEAYIAGIATKSPDALRVSLADKLHNARSILTDHRRHGEAIWDRFKAGEGAPVRWYYRELARAFRAREEDLGEAGRAMLSELELVVAEIDRACA